MGGPRYQRMPGDLHEAEEQAALRRVATLVARGEPSEAVFTAVAQEVGHNVPAADLALVGRYDPDGAVEIVGAWSRTDKRQRLGLRMPPGGRNVYTLVFARNQPARVDHLIDDASAGTTAVRETGARSSAGAPISVEGRLWGLMIVASTRERVLPAGTEHQLADFTELVATAIANAQARMELRGYAEEEAALRRVATLVARVAPPEQVFAAVAAEVGRVLSADATGIGRYDPDGMVTTVGGWASTGDPVFHPLGVRMRLGGRNVVSLVFETGQPARIDDYADASGQTAVFSRERGFGPVVGAPITVKGRLWGVMMVISTSGQPWPSGTEGRLAGFTELVATAIANAETQAELTASRARIVAAADASRRRIERDLHDGAQQRLVSLALHLRAAQAAAPPEAGEFAQRLDGAVTEVTGVVDELREIARGLHPAILSERGLRPALRALARRSAIAVDLTVRTERRLPEPVEVAAYYVVSEALTNTVKHGRASRAEVEVTAGDGVLHVHIRDDGCGGAHFADGSGLAGVRDRVEALGGQIWLESPSGAGTAVQIALPLEGPFPGRSHP